MPQQDLSIEETKRVKSNQRTNKEQERKVI